ncbi:MAG: protein TolR [Cellvibrionales bacterium TMED49]|nr:MAG: protein TolR [Cellvibrionales bacterium TMED49]
MKIKKAKNKLVAEINVVPYIDVMLVLLVVFMIAAPLLIQGVEVELPTTNSSPLNLSDNETLIVSIKADGSYWIDERGSNVADSLENIKIRVSKILRQSPSTPVLVWADGKVDYSFVVDLMSELQEAGAASVGLVTQPLSG